MSDPTVWQKWSSVVNDSKSLHRPLWLQRLGLYGAIILVASLQLGYIYHVLRDFTRATTTVTSPFTYDLAQRVVTRTSAASRAGLHAGDLILAINGQPFTSAATLALALAHDGPESILTVTVQHQDGSILSLPLPLPRRAALAHPAVPFFATVILPLFSTALALWVLATRPRDRMAWILLVLLISYSLLVIEPGWEGPFRTFALLYETVLPESFGLWLLLFGVHFGYVSQWRARILFPAWLIGTLIVVVTLIDAGCVWASETNFSHLLLLRVHYPQLQIAINVLTLAALIVYAATLRLKMQLAGHRSDLYRRIQLVGVGTCAGVGPTFLMVVSRAARGNTVKHELPQAVTALIIFLLLLFPATLAYVILVRRALEVRDILRESFKELTAQTDESVSREFGIALVVALLLNFSGAPHGVTITTSILLLFLLLQFPIVHGAGAWLNRTFLREHYDAERLLMSTVEDADQLEGAEALLGRLVERVSVAFQVKAVAVLLRDGDVFSARNWIGPASARDASLPANGSVAHRLGRSSKPLFLDLDGEDAAVHKLAQNERQTLKLLCSQLLLPLLGSNGTLLGIISLGVRHRDRPFTRVDLRLLQALSSECCLAVENGQLLDRLTREIHERECKQAEKLAAEQASQAKSDFIAHMSHELRTPLNAILGYSEMLQEEAEELGVHAMIRDLARIHTAGKHLLDLINSVLDMAKLEANRAELYLEIIPLELLLHDVIGIASPLAAKNHNTLVCEIPAELGAMETDAMKLRQIILNLLSNASKFTTNGTITLRATSKRVDDTCWVTVQVRDTGMGMTPEQISRLCVPFRQADASIPSRFGGTGLGLAITRRFCQLMGGDLGIESSFGKGSTFSVHLPIATSRFRRELAAPAEVSRPDATDTVLIIDDDPVVHDLVARYCAGLPLRIISSLSGEEGLRRATDENPLCILLDIILPDKNGWDVLRDLRATPRTASMPVFISSIVDGQHIATTLGADGFLSKPLMRRDLLNLLSPLVDRSLTVEPGHAVRNGLPVLSFD